MTDTSLEKNMVWMMFEALGEIVDACEQDCLGPNTDTESDSEPVGRGLDGPMALTFGTIRKARAVVNAVDPNWAINFDPEREKKVGALVAAADHVIQNMDRIGVEALSLDRLCQATVDLRTHDDERAASLKGGDNG